MNTASKVLDKLSLGQVVPVWLALRFLGHSDLALRQVSQSFGRVDQWELALDQVDQ